MDGACGQDGQRPPTEEDVRVPGEGEKTTALGLLDCIDIKKAEIGDDHRTEEPLPGHIVE